ncbi:MAG: ACP S-malonyltransferase [Synergistaceae bacterium]|jgi:[acyl-carrier-protein] S-malonyltransferase|nr:ACP S-malonyltransferase [Synergistaceae bacterium]
MRKGGPSLPANIKYAVVFPGQGAQEVGMGRDFYDKYEVSRAVFAEADDALGFSLSEIIFGGPDEELVKTAVAQPAILVTSIAVLRAVEAELGSPLAPSCYAGHSLGEYTALVAAGVLSLGDAAVLVRRRGTFMQEAVPIGQGTMSAVLGLGLAAVKSICEESARGDICAPANVNSPNQIVISGDAEAVKRAGEIAKERGAAKVIPLKVSAPFHCARMRAAADRLRDEFASLSWRDPLTPVIANVDASPKLSADSIRAALFEQTFSPVLWSDDVTAMSKAGVELFVEIGPGSVLTGLIKRIVKGVKTVSVSRVEDVEAAAGLLAGGTVNES